MKYACMYVRTNYYFFKTMPWEWEMGILTDRNFENNFLKVVIYLALVANI